MVPNERRKKGKAGGRAAAKSSELATARARKIRVRDRPRDQILRSLGGGGLYLCAMRRFGPGNKAHQPAHRARGYGVGFSAECHRGTLGLSPEARGATRHS